MLTIQLKKVFMGKEKNPVNNPVKESFYGERKKNN